MIIYRLSYGLHRGRWVLEVDGVIFDSASNLAILSKLYPTARVSDQYTGEKSTA